MDVKVGDRLTIQKKVTRESAALNYGSGKLENLFATPSLVALMIEAASMLIDDKLGEGFVSAGRVAEVTHIQPTLTGETITCEVKVTAIDGDKITVVMEAYDEVGKIGSGFNYRYIVNKRGLIDRAHARQKELENKDF